MPPSNPTAGANERSGKVSRATLIEELFQEFEALPEAKDLDLDQYVVINVSPSVVPNPYLPSFRVYSYNITGVLDIASSEKALNKKHHHRDRDRGGNNDGVDCDNEKERETWACRPKKPYHIDPKSPSRANQLWSPLGYAQVSHCHSGSF